MKKNVEFIKKISEYNYNKLVSWPKSQEKVSAVITRGGHKTLKVTDHTDGREVFLHSKYDPVREAEKFIEQESKYIEDHSHVFFYGVGLGYHIEVFKRKYPNKFWSIYEPSIEVFQEFMETIDFAIFFDKKFKYLNIEVSDDDRSRFLGDLASVLHDGIAIVTLPSYENVYRKAKSKFVEDFIQRIKHRKQSVMVEGAFSKRWVVNSLQNLQHTFSSKDMLVDYTDKFKGKPIVIVAAGPSLQYEYDNLRRIKEEGQAYIIAVGSANRALVNNDIFPDLVTSYDPQAHNYRVYQPIIDKKITSIPMVYGTSVGFETLMEYPGELVHMMTSQDTVSPYYLKRKDGKELDYINDAPTIAVITLQLALKLEASEIYLVGQNLAFLGDLRYAESVHEQEPERVKKHDKDIKSEEKTLDVYGNEILTSNGFNKMREEMERYIVFYNTKNVINTTKGGAAIAGVPFVPLKKIIEEKLEKSIIKEGWHETESELVYDSLYLSKQVDDMEHSIRIGRRQLKEIFNIIDQIERAYKNSSAKRLGRLLNDFDKSLNKFQKLDVWTVFIERIMKVNTETINKKSHEIVTIADFILRTESFLEVFPLYINQIKTLLEELVPVIVDNHQKLKRRILIAEKKSESALFLSDNPIFTYEGEWGTHQYFPMPSKLYELEEKLTSSRGSKISFDFKGSRLKIYSSAREDRSANIGLTIDGKSYQLSQKYSVLTLKENPQIWYLVFEIEDLDLPYGIDKTTTHRVEMELQDDEIMSLMGIEVFP